MSDLTERARTWQAYCGGPTGEDITWALVGELATEIERLEGLTMDLTDALWNWWGDGSFADPDHVEHAVWCDVPDDCLCGRSLFPEENDDE